MAELARQAPYDVKGKDMMRILAPIFGALVMIALAGPGHAIDDRGTVSEILVKIETKDGPRWYKLSKDKKLTPAEFGEGDFVQFDYADDGTIGAIGVVPEKDKTSKPGQ